MNRLISREFGFVCYYCDQAFSGDVDRTKHIDLYHPGKLLYPRLRDSHNRLTANRVIPLILYLLVDMPEISFPF